VSEDYGAGHPIDYLSVTANDLQFNVSTPILFGSHSPTGTHIKISNNLGVPDKRNPDDVLISTSGKGVIIKDSDGAGCHRITVNTAGTISATSIACP
jgi:hypothetical protein